MHFDDYQHIGRTRKLHGTRGELKVEIEPRWLEDFLRTEVLFLELQGKLVPYFVAQIRGGNTPLLQLEDVEDRQLALPLTSKPIYLRRQDLLADAEREYEVEEENLVYAHLAGYTLVDERLGEIGIIREVLDMPQQEMAVVSYRDTEALVPLAEAWLQRIDANNRRVHMTLPEGLLDLQQ